MSELSFARQFLSALDSRPVKLASDHVQDPRGFPAQSAYILPKTPSLPTKRKRDADATTAPGTSPAAPTLTVALKNLKAPNYNVALAGQPLSASIYDLKTAYVEKAGLTTPVDKIKLLFNKKPTQDSKTLKDLLGDTAVSTKEVELTVMAMGPLVTKNEAEPATTKDAPAAAGASSATTMLQSDAFWHELQGFISQKIGGDQEAERLTRQFKTSWEKSR
ncbi:hypothetical protein EJ06DRAFT_503978 [Trichodelitschia bisporula]|uniref:Ubiquitin-like domain-containing protein n=1 Tax=Trichodelitschia bisporula TaxID=703511 RepID=A0A6G1I8X0_9PEZI|nr:hypothetical protein EJ06DRAFT_503978 [Trichodelitschia bisporula]